MPPRAAPNRGGPRRARGGRTPFASEGRRGGAGRGSQLGANIPSTAAPNLVPTIGVRRPGFGTAGRPLMLEVNSFELKAEENNIAHYDAVTPDNLSGKRKFVLFQHLQNEYPDIFTPKLVYDGQKMAYSTQSINLGDQNARQFNVAFPRTGGGNAAGREPQVYGITLVKVATINTEVLRRFVDGKQAWDENISNALMAYNIAIRTEPNLQNPYRGRSFYIHADRQNIGGGLEVWRGIFQSVRPVIGRLVVNIDLSATTMYREGPLVRLINEFYGNSPDLPPLYMVPGHVRFPPQYAKVRLLRFLRNLRVSVCSTGEGRPRAINGLTTNGADAEFFDTREGARISVADYFNQIGLPLQYPSAICVVLGKDAKVPLEMCTVLRGQFANRDTHLGPNQVADVLKFATKKPVERMDAIKKGIQVTLQFGQSNYIAQFGLTITEQPMKVKARIIDPPNIRYSDTDFRLSIMLRFSRLDKKFKVPVTIQTWGIAIYESSRRFSAPILQEMITAFQRACARVGINIVNVEPVTRYITNPQGVIETQLRQLGVDCIKKYKTPPHLLLVVLPEGANEIYTAVKHCGDVTMGVATQCLIARKCTRAKDQYWANVMLKVNVKLGGINSISESGIMDYITDPANPAIVIGADVIHPPPHSQGRPSFTAVVGSVDSNAAKYVSTSHVQVGRREMIVDLKEMVKNVLEKYKDYRLHMEKKAAEHLNPKRLFFFRDGVSEGEFDQVLKQGQCPCIHYACEELGMSPKITLIVVGKRHHNQMFPSNNRENKNAPAGTVIDTDITHPLEFDFILQSHEGILGTSRPAHYSVLLDVRHYADAMQALSYALCHVYAPACRSVSIPAPVYYADGECARAKNRFQPGDQLGMSDTGTQASGGAVPDLEAYKRAYKPINIIQENRMYFVVSHLFVLPLPCSNW
ncbi:hypothetical protein HYPSUDRAFT_143440 [Hypholoma sublateritium FD-334 SS-4]|uniref:Uncharacterized protein n=1 Tax=Hypholoma sublateritium (strain FD-334 SS-4) TaxID=945553 RepID=A0A0D2NT04_HYPSF|nr:hypothetical protein HYPSUDRAFT_143440 [Hypholoma sublateritium FD-334 SS-4]